MIPIYYKLYILFGVELAIIVILLFLTRYLFMSLKKYKKDFQFYKIHNVFFNDIYIILYISFFILLFNYLRIKRLAIDVDLKRYYNYYLDFLTLTPINRLNAIFILPIILLVILILLLLVIKINNFFIEEIKKRYLFVAYIKTNKGNATYNMYIEKNIYDSVVIYGYNAIISLPIMGFIKKILLFFNRNLIDRIDSYNSRIRFFIRLVPVTIPLILIIYDCYHNNFVISKVFIYLLFFVPYNFYYNITTFIWQTFSPYNIILYEDYYCRETLMIVNVPEEIETRLTEYINDDLFEAYQQAFQDSLYVEALHAYYSKDGIRFTNHAGEYFLEEQNVKP